MAAAILFFGILPGPLIRWSERSGLPEAPTGFTQAPPAAAARD
jgi:hypothetical protein